MKQRFSSLDVKIIAHELAASLVSLRVSNVYDLSTRIFLLKFAKPEHKEQLLIDSGFRCHLTSFSRTTAAAPSPFIARLRKFLKTRRVTAVSQVGTDRIIDIQFSDGQYRLFLEFYAGGNIVLTDSELNILALLRNVNEGEEHEQYRVGLKYNLSLRQNYGGIPPLTKERVREGLQRVIQKQGQDGGQGKKIKKKQGDALRKALAVTINEYPPILLDHALQTAGFDKETQPSDVVENDALLEKLMGVFDEAAKVMADITSRDTAKGYIVAKTSGKEQGPPSDGQTDAESQRAGVMYDDFHPFKPIQLEGKPDTTFLEFDGFNKTVDEFFSSIEGQRLESKLQEREDNAKKRLEQARTEHEKRIGGLQQVQELNVQKAEAIEANLDRVEEATAAVNGLIAQGMDWVEIGRLIEMEQKKHNPVADMIKLPLKLHENTVTLKLSGWTADEEDDEMADETDSEASDSDEEQAPAAKQKPAEDKRLAVDIDLSLSPWSNARQYYDQRKTAAVKQDKTQQASAKALKSTEQRITSDLKKGLKQEKAVLRPVRQQMWFEKFIYFISSDGYLIIGSKDAQQSEVIYRRHLKKGDIYVHADLPGAAPVIIKNNTATPDAPIPPTTLSQAGNLCVCSSNAWESKAVMSAWWVNADEVSKTAPTGEYLATGNFTIKGKKNFLPPAQLLLGFAVMFQISEESKAQHMKHRLRDEPSDTPHEVTTSAPAENPRNEEQDDDDDGNEEEGTADEDDEFPDVKAAATDEDDDDDFPDAKDDNDDEEHHEDHQARSNPLQNGQPTAKEEDESSDDDDEDVAEAPGSGAASTVDEDEHASQSTSGVRHLSAKERRQLKKSGASSTEEPSDKVTDPAPENKGPKAASAPKPQQLTRGKRAKAKRQAQKYADQDDEDRALAMSLLGSRKAETTAPAADDSKTETAEEARERRRQQHEKTQKAGLEAEELRRLKLADDAAADLDDDETSAHVISLDQFVGMPLPGDEILEAIPVCAPWNALGKYKYKAKLQPGAQKKGKAVREILGRWGKGFAETKYIDEKAMDKERIWPREAELIRAFKEAEVMGVVPVKQMRVMMAGGSGGGGGGDKTKGKKGRGGRGSKKK